MKPAVLGCGRRYFRGLEQHLPCAFVRHVVELLERPVFGWDELPQTDRPPLAGQDSADEHDLDHVDKLDVLVLHAFDACWSPASSVESPQDRPFFSQEVSRMGAPDQNSGAAAQLAPCGSVM